MGENFSRIEEYINKTLSEDEKNRFEAELETDGELAERYNFYKNLKQELPKEIKPFGFNKKILPEINEINFTEKKQKKGLNRGAAAGILIIFIAVSGYLLLSSVSQNKNIAALESIIDSLKVENEQVANIQLNTTHEEVPVKNDSVRVLRDLIAAKENEIVALKLNNESNEALKDEVKELKKELSGLKQEYYENNGNYAANDANDELDDFIKSIDIFNPSLDNVAVKWNSADKFRISMHNYKNGNKIYTSPGLVKKTFTTAIPDYGFYVISFKPVSKKEIKVLVSINKSTVPEIFYKR